MYLRALRIHNLKLIRELKLDFDPKPDASENMWTVLIGRNGRGKTSVLRAVAVAAAGAFDGNELARKWSYSLPPRREPPVRPSVDGLYETDIWADFRFGTRPPTSVIDEDDRTPSVGFTTSIQRFPDEDGMLFASALYNDKDSVGYDVLGHDPYWLGQARRRRDSMLFVAGYGNTRRVHEPGEVAKRSGHIHRLASLFDPEFKITGLDFFRHIGNGRADRYHRLLDRALFHGSELMHEVMAVSLANILADDSGLPDVVQQSMAYRATLDLPGGPIEVPTAWLADGQQALLSWLADLIGHLMLDQKDVTDPADFEGLVLVDDIDLHIHPDWQTRLVPALKRAFPKLQFIVTTHSPLIIASLRPEEVIELDLDESGSVVAHPLDVDPRLMTSTELYRRIFGVHETPPDPIFTVVKRYEFLCFTPYRTDEQEAERKRLRRQLVAAGIQRIARPVKREPLPPAP